MVQGAVLWDQSPVEGAIQRLAVPILLVLQVLSYVAGVQGRLGLALKAGELFFPCCWKIFGFVRDGKRQLWLC